MEQFVFQNSKYQCEFELIQKVKLNADMQVLFPDKTILYRTEKDDEVIVFRWRNIAAAAIIFIFLGGLGWYLNLKEDSSSPIVQTTLQKSNSIEVPQKSSPENTIIKTDPAINETVTTAIKKAESKEIRFAQKPKQKMETNTPDLLTVSENEDKNIEGRNIQIATTVTIERTDIKIDRMKASNTSALQPRKEIIDVAVGEIEDNPYAFETSNDEIEILNTTISKKNRLRGIFRKVSRIVEKTTNIDPGDVKGIRIANFEIGLK